MYTVLNEREDKGEMMLRTEINQTIIDFLKMDLIQNLNILGIIENSDHIECYVDNVEHPSGVLVNKGYFNYIYTKNEKFIEALLQTHFKEDFYGFSGLSAFVTEKLKPHFTVQWESPCTLHYLPKDALELSLKKHSTVEVDIKDAEIIDQHYAYRGDGSLNRIKEDIIRRPSSAIYIDGQPACWVLVHQDNSMGIMYTMEQHRGKGYAVDVTIDLCEKIINKGQIPFLQINTFNHMSPGLARRCGFIEYGRGNWFGGFRGVPQYLKDRMIKVQEQLALDFGNVNVYNALYGTDQIGLILNLFGNEDVFSCEGYEFITIDREIEQQVNEWVDASIQFTASKAELQDVARMGFEALKMNRSYQLYSVKRNGNIVVAAAVHTEEHEAWTLCHVGVNNEDDQTEKVKALLLGFVVQDWDTLLYSAPANQLGIFQSLESTLL